MEKPVYRFDELEQIVNGWIRQRLAQEALEGQLDSFGKIDSCEVVGVPV